MQAQIWAKEPVVTFASGQLCVYGYELSFATLRCFIASFLAKAAAGLLQLAYRTLPAKERHQVEFRMPK